MERFHSVFEVLIFTCAILVVSSTNENETKGSLKQLESLKGLTGKGKAFPIPVESLTLEFADPLVKITEPVINGLRKSSGKSSRSERCLTSCDMPAVPAEMDDAIKHCRAELVFGETDGAEEYFFDSPPALSKSDLPINPERSRPQRQVGLPLEVCGSKCVLEQMSMIRSTGLPDNEKYQQMLGKVTGPEWDGAIQRSDRKCMARVSFWVQYYQFLWGSYQDENSLCELSNVYIRCMKHQLKRNCPGEHIIQVGPGCPTVTTRPPRKLGEIEGHQISEHTIGS